VATAAAEWRWWRQRGGGGGGSAASSAAFPQREARRQRGNGASGSSPEARWRWWRAARWQRDGGGHGRGSRRHLVRVCAECSVHSLTESLCIVPVVVRVCANVQCTH
jgi:hypothetical protein